MRERQRAAEPAAPDEPRRERTWLAWTNMAAIREMPRCRSSESESASRRSSGPSLGSVRRWGAKAVRCVIPRPSARRLARAYGVQVEVLQEREERSERKAGVGGTCRAERRRLPVAGESRVELRPRKHGDDGLQLQACEVASAGGVGILAGLRLVLAGQELQPLFPQPSGGGRRICAISSVQRLQHQVQQVPLVAL